MAERYKKIVVPVDGSGWSERAVPHACDIALNNDGEVILLHVFKPPAYEYADQLALAGDTEYVDQMRQEIKQHLTGLRNQIREQNIEARVQFIEAMGVANQICDYVNDQEIDLVVMSTHGRTGLARFLFGSVANKVVQGVDVPVMLIRPDKDQ